MENSHSSKPIFDLFRSLNKQSSEIPENQSDMGRRRVPFLSKQKVINCWRCCGVITNWCYPCWFFLHQDMMCSGETLQNFPQPPGWRWMLHLCCSTSFLSPSILYWPAQALAGSPLTDRVAERVWRNPTKFLNIRCRVVYWIHFSLNFTHSIYLLLSNSNSQKKQAFNIAFRSPLITKSY
jgi:hypothetical protein